MGLFSSKNKDGSIGTNLAFIDGLDAFTENESIELSVYKDDNEIQVKSRSNKKKPLAHLNFNKITKIAMMTEKEIIEKSKSVGGRALAGGLLLGPLGAIIGGMSGIGNKNKSATEYYIIINYKSNDEEKALSFKVIGASMGWDKVFKEIKSHLKNEIQTDIEL